MTHGTITSAAAETLARNAGDLRVADTRTLRGPNVWHLEPVIVAELRAGHLAELSPADADDLLERIRAAFPALQLQQPLSWGKLVELVTLELQRLAGSPVDFGRVQRDAPAEDHWTLLIGFDDEDLGH
jgi:cyanophycin synthetase